MRWLLEELGVPYQTVLLDYATTLKEPKYLSVNSMGKVPAIRHGNIIVPETAAIGAYLADAFASAGLAPTPGRPLRGPYDRWLFFTAGPIEAAVSNQALGFVVSKGRERSIGYGAYERAMDVLESAVSQSEYLLGDAFSAVDIYAGSYLGFAMQTGGIEKRPVFGAYWSRISARPAVVCAKQIDDAPIPRESPAV